MTARKYRDITIQGTTYPDVDAASKALKVHPVSIRKHLRDGTIDRCGLGVKGPAPVPVKIRGCLYESAQAAADALGVSREMVYRRLAAGRPDDIGKPDKRGMHCAVPFEIGPFQFPSVSEAARALGFTPNYLHRMRHGGGNRMRQRVLAAAMKLVAEQEARVA